LAIAILFLDKRSLFCDKGAIACGSETGFLILNLGIVAKIVAETRFLGL